MNKRVIEISASLNKMAVVPEELTQGDKNTHFINLKFLKDVEVLGYQLLVFYKLPYPDERILVDTYNDLKTEMNILIPSEALKRSGELVIEFSLKKDEELITVNKNVTLNIISTINGTFVDAALEGNIKETIDQQVAKITILLEQSQNKIDEYNENTVTKIKEFDTHVENSKENINTYIEEKVAPAVNDYIETNSKPKIDSYIELKEKTIKGATFTPTVSESGDLSWTNDKGLENPPIVNIKGPKGEPGTDGGGSGEIDTSNLLKKGNLPKEIETAEDLLSLMEKKSGATFNRNLLYLNDKGIKEEGKLYFDRNKQGLFKCKKTTTADYVVNSTDYFVDVSNVENSNRLSNLSKLNNAFDEQGRLKYPNGNLEWIE